MSALRLYTLMYPFLSFFVVFVSVETDVNPLLFNAVILNGLECVCFHSSPVVFCSKSLTLRFYLKRRLQRGYKQGSKLICDYRLAPLCHRTIDSRAQDSKQSLQNTQESRQHTMYKKKRQKLGLLWIDLYCILVWTFPLHSWKYFISFKDCAALLTHREILILKHSHLDKPLNRLSVWASFECQTPIDPTFRTIPNAAL